MSNNTFTPTLGVDHTLAKMRILLAIVAYATSSVGIFSSLGATGLSLVMIARPSMFDSPQSYLFFLAGFVVLYAWIAHLVMCINWIANKRLETYWPASGSVAALLSILYFANVLSSTGGASLTIGKLFLALIAPIIWTFPAFLLAIHLVRFHLSSGDEQGKTVANH
ncbi:hypothetical protein U5817_17920 [Aromatoleum evansii]|uniref:Transmembrane protein n=1 Tax=Aromatoleum evansii TaxID=59406 RepID=A0ABZ1AKV5_AROEV|nr:hypothetical protein U5817_17920 [Aromatoleum evansii]